MLKLLINYEKYDVWDGQENQQVRSLFTFLHSWLFAATQKQVKILWSHFFALFKNLCPAWLNLQPECLSLSSCQVHFSLIVASNGSCFPFYFPPPQRRGRRSVSESDATQWTLVLCPRLRQDEDGRVERAAVALEEWQPPTSLRSGLGEDSGPSRHFTPLWPWTPFTRSREQFDGHVFDKEDFKKEGNLSSKSSVNKQASLLSSSLFRLEINRSAWTLLDERVFSQFIGQPTLISSVVIIQC